MQANSCHMRNTGKIENILLDFIRLNDTLSFKSAEEHLVDLWWMANNTSMKYAVEGFKQGYTISLT